MGLGTPKVNRRVVTAGVEMTSWRGSQDLGRRIARRFNYFLPHPAVERRLWPSLIIVAATVLLLLGITAEIRNSWFQSVVFSRWAESMTFHVEEGSSTAIRFPAHGPFDRQRGYTELPKYLGSLRGKGFAIDRQARMSPTLAAFQLVGGFPPYQEKTVSGLTLLSNDGRPFYAARYPENSYGSFSDVPAIVRNSLLFVENRELFDPAHPRRNPAVEWDRLWLAMFKFGASETAGGSRPGGSTLATQIEKFRHSPDGRTTGASEKLRQMVSATLRAYRDGPDTAGARKRIILEALDSMPLAAVRGHGEVIGLGDGLQLWYGSDFDETNRLLRTSGSDVGLSRKALAYKQVLSLIIAQRRPSWYLGQGRQDLEALTDSYIRLMAAAGGLDRRLRDAALHTRLQFHRRPPENDSIPDNTTKASSAMRIRLLTLLGMSSLYDLDRIDLTAETTLDAEAQARITEVLRSLNDPENLAGLGLLGPRLLKSVQPARVVYSFTLYETGGSANFLRIQTDSLDQPLDLNVGSKMELGSTAKVRTLITYLEIIADLRDVLRPLPAASLENVATEGDPLTQWVAQYLLENGDQGLPGLLQAAMERTYSSSPYERFFTAGGMHRFVNFDRKFSGGKLPVAKAIEQSVNLVFIRMMRDIVDYQIARIPGTKGIMDDPNHPLRRVYLNRFADMEGRQYLWRFYPQYRNLDRAGILARIAERSKYLKPRLAASFRTVLPRAPYETFAAFIDRWALVKIEDAASMQKLYDTYATDRLNLADRSYVASVHPLELWLAGYLYAHPHASWQEVVERSADVRQESYGWLFKPNRIAAQNRRIRVLLEQQAFVKIHKQWQRLGYPFDHLVPSYATAIGTSGDRPDALAELMGIIVNRGVRLPTVRFTRLRFAASTPYETQVRADPAAGQQVLRPEIADVARKALIDVVENGTARRASGALHAPDGSNLVIGAKTGTGDNRTQQFGRGRRLIGSVVRSRTATLMFFIDDRFFGTITAHVDGPEAAQYRFTSALPAQLFKSLAPILQPLVDQPGPPRPTPAPILRQTVAYRG